MKKDTKVFLKGLLHFGVSPMDSIDSISKPDKWKSKSKREKIISIFLWWFWPEAAVYKRYDDRVDDIAKLAGDLKVKKAEKRTNRHSTKSTQEDKQNEQ